MLNEKAPASTVLILGLSFPRDWRQSVNTRQLSAFPFMRLRGRSALSTGMSLSQSTEEMPWLGARWFGWPGRAVPSAVIHQHKTTSVFEGIPSVDQKRLDSAPVLETPFGMPPAGQHETGIEALVSTPSTPTMSIGGEKRMVSSVQAELAWRNRVRAAGEVMAERERDGGGKQQAAMAAHQQIQPHQRQQTFGKGIAKEEAEGEIRVDGALSFSLRPVSKEVAGLVPFMPSLPRQSKFISPTLTALPFLRLQPRERPLQSDARTFYGALKLPFLCGRHGAGGAGEQPLTTSENTRNDRVQENVAPPEALGRIILETEPDLIQPQMPLMPHTGSSASKTLCALSIVTESIESLVLRQVKKVIKEQEQKATNVGAVPGQEWSPAPDKQLFSDQIVRQLLRKMRSLAEEERFRSGFLR